MPDSTKNTSTLYPTLTYADAPAAIDWLCRAFGFTKQFVVRDGKGAVMHSELSFGNGVIMVSSPKPSAGRVAPKPGPKTESQSAICAYVKDPDAHYAIAIAAGASITRELRNEEFGFRGYIATDIEGYSWYFGNYLPGEHWGQDVVHG
ncbi:MAG: glyoxalase [Planctomycetes bacterium]|nr:glyoxalase [Planctomycetota bacterium]